MIASLPMYAWPGNAAAHDALWALIRDNLRDARIAAPDTLDRQVDHIDSWAREDLVLGQICNLPYRKLFRDRLTLIGASDYGLGGCPPGYYRSHFVVHRDTVGDDPTGFHDARFICNDTLSQSGYGAPQLWAQARGTAFTNVTTSGSHLASICAIAEGRADIAAIDAQTWQIACTADTPTQMLRIIGHTDISPGQSFVTRQGEDPAPYFHAITTAINDLTPDHAATLGLRGIVSLDQSAYDLPFPPDLPSNPG